MVDIEQLKEQFFSLSGGVFLLGKLCLGATFFFVLKGYGFYLGENSLGFSEFDVASASILDENSEGIFPLSHYEVISSRNLFAFEEEVEQKEESAPSPLNMRLIGTHLRSGGGSIAIIEETKKRKQDVFREGTQVFGTAKLVKVEDFSVKLEFQGKEEILELKQGGSGGGNSSDDPEKNEAENEFSIGEEELQNALGNLPKLLSQARAVPYFRNGKSIGMRLFAIRKSSLYEKIGLKNGDIIKSINDNSVADPSQAIELFKKLQSERAIYATVERQGKEIDLRLSID